MINLFNKSGWGKISADEARARQNRALRKFVRSEVFPHCAHYRNLFREAGMEPGDFGGIEDLSKLPFTGKADLASAVAEDRSRDFLILPDPDALRKRPANVARALLTGIERTRLSLDREYRPILLTSTTGRSADPVPFLYTRHDVENLGMLGHRIMEAGEATREDRVLNVFPYAPHLGYWLTYHAADEAGAFHLGTGGGKTLGTDGNVRLLVKVRPSVLVGMPTFVYHMLRRALELGERVESLKLIALGGEKAPAGLRRKLASLAAELGSPNTRTLATYGFTEAKAAWPECAVPPFEEPTGYHLSPEHGLVEIVDPKTGEPVEDGMPGEVVYTPLDARGTIVMRYRTGDLAEGGISWERCPVCMRTLPRLLGRISRVSEKRRMQLDKLKGSLVDFNELEVILDDVEGIGAWQLELRKVNDDPLDLDELNLRISPEPGFTEHELEQLVRRKFREVTEVTPNNVSYHPADEMRRLHGVGKALKEEKIIDRRGETKSAPAPTRPRRPRRKRNGRVPA